MPVATVTAVDTTPTGGTIAVGTVALVPADQAFVMSAGAAMLGEIDFARHGVVLPTVADTANQT